MDCSRPPRARRRDQSQTRRVPAKILYYVSMICARGRKEGPLYQLSERRSIDPPPDAVVRSAKASQFISFMSPLDAKAVYRYLIVRYGNGYCGNVSGNCTFFLRCIGNCCIFHHYSANSISLFTFNLLIMKKESIIFEQLLPSFQ